MLGISSRGSDCRKAIFLFPSNILRTHPNPSHHLHQLSQSAQPDTSSSLRVPESSTEDLPKTISETSAETVGHDTKGNGEPSLALERESLQIKGICCLPVAPLLCASSPHSCQGLPPTTGHESLLCFGVRLFFH